MTNAYDKAAKFYANQRTSQLRELLRRDYGARKYRLSGRDVYVHGKMPNSIETGWYLKGSRAAVESEYCI